MQKARVPESVIVKIIGHSTREMFDNYNMIDAEDAKMAADRFGVFVRHLDEGEGVGEWEGWIGKD